MKRDNLRGKDRVVFFETDYKADLAWICIWGSSKRKAWEEGFHPNSSGRMVPLKHFAHRLHTQFPSPCSAGMAVCGFLLENTSSISSPYIFFACLFLFAMSWRQPQFRTGWKDRAPHSFRTLDTRKGSCESCPAYVWTGTWGQVGQFGLDVV